MVFVRFVHYSSPRFANLEAIADTSEIREITLVLLGPSYSRITRTKEKFAGQRSRRACRGGKESENNLIAYASRCATSLIKMKGLSLRARRAMRG